MKALTIKEPWASLIINGYKEYEFRSWKINYRGKILIHAGLRVARDKIDLFGNYNIDCINGAIIGEVTITDCILVNEEFNRKLQCSEPLVYGNGNYIGKYAWKLENVVKYNEPIYCKGKLGLWTYEMEK